ncbi:LexA repressor [compost metagenome]
MTHDPDKAPSEAIQAEEAACLDVIYNRRKKEWKGTGRRISQQVIADTYPGGTWTQSVVNQYLKGRIPLNAPALRHFANFLEFEIEEVSPRIAEIISPSIGERPGAYAAESNTSRTTLAPHRAFPYPELSLVEAGMPKEGIDFSQLGETHPIHYSDAWAERAYWLRVTGPSMTAPPGQSPSFPDGILVLVAPDIEPLHGSFVAARLVDSNNEATFKQLIRDANRLYLSPLNPAFPTIELDETWVIDGTVIDAKWPQQIFRR